MCRWCCGVGSRPDPIDRFNVSIHRDKLDVVVCIAGFSIHLCFCVLFYHFVPCVDDGTEVEGGRKGGWSWVSVAASRVDLRHGRGTAASWCCGCFHVHAQVCVLEWCVFV